MTLEHPLLSLNMISLCKPWLPKNRATGTQGHCKRIAYSSLDNLVWVSIIQLALRSLEFTINSSFPSCSRRHGIYYIALLGSVVISVLICVPIATSAQTKLV